MTKVLLVEDDNNLREIYEARLAAEGYEISTAKDGEDALAVAKQVKPDLIISDVMMPRISGFEMLDILRNTEGLKHTRIIMLTALGQSEDKSRADNLGADRYLVKSQVTLEDIVKAADELLNPTAQNDTDAMQAPVDAGNPIPTTAAAFSPTAPPDVAAAAHQAPVVTPQPEQMVSTLEVNDNPEAVVTAVPESMPVSQPAPVEPVVTPAQPTPTPQPDQPIVASQAMPTQPTAPTPADQQPVVAMPTQPIPAPLPSDPQPQPTIAPQPVVAPIAPVPEVSIPQPTTTTPVESTAVPAQPTTPAVDNQQTTSEENAAIAQQIQNFVNTDPTQPASQPTPAQNTDTPNNDDIIQSAVDNLSATTPEDNTPANLSQVSGKKVIQPISDPSQDVNQLETLLAQEEMKANSEAGVTGAPIVGAGTIEQTPPTPQNAPQIQEVPVAESPSQPAPNSVFMPNNGGDADKNAL